ncbi:hypothetical protein ACSFA0_23660 [Variovorax sp. LT1P1]|uniref:hypothetical protein n=1 Tax=Variovorax sp. LT1P1 TaxID=3443730 RepID=UPI003F479D8C
MQTNHLARAVVPFATEVIAPSVTLDYRERLPRRVASDDIVRFFAEGAPVATTATSDAAAGEPQVGPDVAVIRFVVNRATKAAIEAVLTCAMDNAPYWRMFFKEGLAEAIAEEPEYETLFFKKLCEGVGLPYSAEIIDEYLTTLPQEHKERFLASALKRKTHPAARSFVAAAEDTQSGAFHCKIVETFAKHGLRFDALGSGLLSELEAAVLEGHEKFIYSMLPHFETPPAGLLVAIMSRSKNPADVVNLLVSACGLPLAAFADPKILAEAKPCARDYVVGLMARQAARELERPVVDCDDEQEAADFAQQ